MAPPKTHPLVQQARAALSRGELQYAAHLVGQRLAEFAGDVNARMTLADIQLLAGRTEEAIESMRLAVRAVSDNPLMHVKLGHMLMHESRWADVLDAADRALKLDAACIPAIALKSAVFERQDKYAKAEKLLARPAAAERPHADIGPVAMRVMLHGGRPADALAFADRWESANPEPGRGLRSVRFERARAHELAGDVDAAMAAAAEAHATAPARWARSDEKGRFDAIRAATGRAAMDALPRAATTEADPPIVFIVGMPRTGATIIERALHAHPEATGIGDDPTIHRIAYTLHQRGEGWAPYPGCLSMLTPELVAAARADARLGMRRRSGRGRVLVNRGLGNVMHLGLIAMLFPEARIIHPRRDPLDTGISAWMSPLGGVGTGYANSLEDIGWYQRHVDAMLAHWRSVTDLPILDVDYESMIRDQRATTEAILAHCGLSWNDACLEPHRVNRVETGIGFDRLRRPLDDTSIGRAARFGAHLDPLRESLAATED
jgi:tetratricopeptide (TPR) repeat protein